MAKKHEDIKKELEYEDEDKMLPANWKEHDVRGYFEKGIKMQQERELKYEYRRKAREEYSKLENNCYNCIYMKNGECEDCNEEYSDESCDYWQERL